MSDSTVVAMYPVDMGASMDWDRIRREKKLQNLTPDELQDLLKSEAMEVSSNDDSVRESTFASLKGSSNGTVSKQEVPISQLIPVMPRFEKYFEIAMHWARAFKNANDFGALGKPVLVDGFLKVADEKWAELSSEVRDLIINFYKGIE